MASLAVHGLNWSGEKVSFFLEDWELARVALSCHVALDMLWQEMHEAWELAAAAMESVFSHRGRAKTIKEQGCGERK